MDSLLNSQDNEYQVYDYESINEFQENLNILIQQQLINNIDSKVSQATESSEQELEMENLLNTFDHITKNNFSKNVIKSFFSFLLNKNNTDQVIEFVQNGQTFKQQQILKKFKNFSQNYNYNNNSLQKLILHPVFGKIFEFYLTFEAQKWLNESKVQQKDKHLIYINFLKLCCSNTSYLDKLTKYNKRIKSKYNDRS
ncbi:hypothetical protein ABPG74_015469 [Tetrahymena malaccensis]